MIRRCSFLLCTGAATIPPTASAPAADAGAASEKHATLTSLRLTPYAGKVASPEAMASFRDPRRAPVGESTEALRRRVVYQSQYRGMVEMDVILGSFVKKHLPLLSGQELIEYDAILKQFDNDLYNWLLMGTAPEETVGALPLWKKLSEHVSQNREELLNFRV